MTTIPMTILIETRPLGVWIGDEYIQDLAREGYILHAFGDIHTIAGNAPLGAGFTKYIFYRVHTE